MSVPCRPSCSFSPPCSADDDAGTDEAAGTEESESGETGDSEGYTWWRDVQPIVQQKCASCHRDEDIAPFALDTHASFVALAPILAGAIETGAMPPWRADPDCNSYSNDRSLSVEQEEILLTYIAGDMPEGDPADAPPDQDPQPEFVPDIVLEMPEAYTPTQSPDDYRCFLIPWPEDISEERFITGFEVYPGERSMVHHVIAFMAAPTQVESFQDLDAAEPGTGYTCFGGPGGPMGSARWVGAWVPGSEPFVAPEGVGQRIEPGSMMIVQVHYHPAPGDALADRSSIGLQLESSVARLAEVFPMTDIAWLASDGSMSIPADDPDVTHEVALTHADPLVQLAVLDKLGITPDTPLEIWSVGLHMHLFGKRGRIEVRDGNEQTCLLDVPDWDFNWQSDHVLDQSLVFRPGQQLHLQCWWDNSGANQPIVDGQPVESVDRDWGEGTLDEMCLGVLYVSAADG